MKKAMLITTADNPFDPFTQFTEWYNYDVNIKGYNTCAYIDKLAPTSDENLTDYENGIIIDQANNEILDIGYAVDRDGKTVPYLPVFEGQANEW